MNKADHDEMLDYLYGRLLPERAAAFEKRMNAEAALRAAFERERALNRKLELVTGLAAKPGAIAAVRQKIAAQKTRGRLLLWRVLAPAAGIAAALIIAVLIYLPSNGPATTEPDMSNIVASRSDFQRARDFLVASNDDNDAAPSGAPPLDDPLFGELVALMEKPAALTDVANIANLSESELDALDDLDTSLALESALDF